MQLLNSILINLLILFANGVTKNFGNNDLITGLPGQPVVTFKQFSGYVNVDVKKGTELFFWFFEAANNPEEKPLVLWLQGGFGCSSLMGAMLELGPFRVNSDGRTLFLNEYAWNTEANVIFLESPIGVGFSHSNNTDVYNAAVGDNSTATDSYNFLIGWLKRFPQYEGRALFLAGESYAGHYVPQLAEIILTGNKKRNQTILNLQGIAIGNGLFNAVTDSLGSIDFLWSHAMLSDETYNRIHSKCGFDDDRQTIECMRSLSQARKEMGVGYIDIQNVYAPLCHDPYLKNRSVVGSVHEVDPCSGIYLEAYLNLPEVQRALHAKPVNWHHCSLYNWLDSPSNVLPVLKNVMSGGIRVWIYSGDVGSIVPVTSTRYTINSLKLPVRTHWFPWFADKEVGGYAIEYEGLLFATVKGAAHSVPSNQPERALILFSSFLQNVLPPTKP